jgi:hypothetical protein
MTESFSSCFSFADLRDVDGLGELSGAPGQQRIMRRMCQFLSLGVGEFAG